MFPLQALIKRKKEMKELVLSIAGALLLTACADQQSREPQLDTAAIGFATSVTRSATGPVSGFAAGDSFDVWAQMVMTDAGGSPLTDTPVTVFSEEPVTTADGTVWSYVNTKYWEVADYAFAAIFPAEVDGASVAFDTSGNPVFSIANYNATANYDLMTASQTVSYRGTASPVQFQFEHLLSLVSIAGRAENGNVTINSITLTGVSESGSYDSASGWSGLAAGNGFTASNIQLNGTTADVIGNKLMIPQPVGGMEVSVNYKPDGASASLSATYELPVTEFVSSWEPGRSYRYTFVVYGNRIIFDKPTVTAWDDATGGIIVVE
mgnify:CR=1 FL=1